MKIHLALLLILTSSPLFAGGDEACTISPDPSQDQYIVAYGSLIDEKSKQNTYKDAGPNFPVQIDGFERGFMLNASGRNWPGFSTTFLGIHAEKNASMNAAYFYVGDVSAIALFDHREIGYCRTQVNKTSISPLGVRNLPEGQFWVYESTIHSLPSERFPIVQSYVDEFITGCIELGTRFDLDDFSEKCITQTKGWSEHWVNDRLYPRRPFHYVKEAIKIDQLLSDNLPEYFDLIRIE